MPWEKSSIGIGNPKYIKDKFDPILKKMDDLAKIMENLKSLNETAKLLFLAQANPLVFIWLALIKETENLVNDIANTGIYGLSLLPGDKTKILPGKPWKLFGYDISGEIDPTTEGKDGDIYWNSKSDTYWKKSEGVWGKTSASAESSGVTKATVERFEVTADFNLIALAADVFRKDKDEKWSPTSGMTLSSKDGTKARAEAVAAKDSGDLKKYMAYKAKRTKWFWPDAQIGMRNRNDGRQKMDGAGSPDSPANKKGAEQLANESIYRDTKTGNFWEKLENKWTLSRPDVLFSIGKVTDKDKRGFFDRAGFPLQTPAQILDKMIMSFDDRDDTQRPVFSESSAITGFGFIITFPYLFDFVKLLEPFVALFGFKPLVDFVNNLIKYRPDTPSQQKPGTPTPPNWRRYALSDTPVVGPLVKSGVELSMEYLNILRGMTISLDQAIIDLFDIYASKIQDISDFVNRVNDLMKFIEKAFLNQGIYIYKFWADTGGVAALKTDLRSYSSKTFKTKPEDRDNPYLALPISDQNSSKYSAGMLFIAGGPMSASFKIWTDLIQGVVDKSQKVSQRNETKKITFTISSGGVTESKVPDTGTWRIGWSYRKLKTDKKDTYENTTDLKFNSSAADVQSSLNSTYAFSEVKVTGDFLEGFSVEFTGIDGYKDQPDFFSNEAGGNEVQRLLFLSKSPTTGYFRIGFRGKESCPFGWGTAANLVEATKENIQEHFNRVMFAGACEKQKIELSDMEFLGTKETSTIVVNGGGASFDTANLGVKSIQSTIPNVIPDSGSFKLGLDGSISAEIQYNSTALQVKAILENLSGIGTVMPEIVSITVDDDGSFYDIVSARYFKMSSYTTSYVVWFKVTDSLNVPFVKQVVTSTPNVAVQAKYQVATAIPATDTKQQVRVTISTCSNNTHYVYRINGTDFDYTSDATATESEIGSGLIALVNASGVFPVIASGSGSNTILFFTARTAGVEFTYSSSLNLATSVVTPYTPLSTYSQTVNGVTYSHTAGSPPVATEIVTGLKSLMTGPTGMAGPTGPIEVSGTTSLVMTSRILGTPFVYSGSANLAQHETTPNVTIPVYSQTINGESYAFTSDGTPTPTEVVTGLRNLINADADNATIATGTTTLIMTAKVAGNAFTYSGSSNLTNILTQANADGSPTVAGTKVPVVMLKGDTAAQIATKLSSALDALDDFSCTGATGGTFQATHQIKGQVSAVTPETSGITSQVVQEGKSVVVTGSGTNFRIIFPDELAKSNLTIVDNTLTKSSAAVNVGVSVEVIGVSPHSVGNYFLFPDLDKTYRVWFQVTDSVLIQTDPDSKINYTISGDTDPTPSTGSGGDVYYNTTTLVFWKKKDYALTGSGEPSVNIGNDGDIYLDSSLTKFWIKNTTWAEYPDIWGIFDVGTTPIKVEINKADSENVIATKVSAALSAFDITDLANNSFISTVKAVGKTWSSSSSGTSGVSISSISGRNPIPITGSIKLSFNNMDSSIIYANDFTEGTLKTALETIFSLTTDKIKVSTYSLPDVGGGGGVGNPDENTGVLGDIYYSNEGRYWKKSDTWTEFDPTVVPKVFFVGFLDKKNQPLIKIKSEVVDGSDVFENYLNKGGSPVNVAITTIVEGYSPSEDGIVVGGTVGEEFVFTFGGPWANQPLGEEINVLENSLSGEGGAVGILVETVTRGKYPASNLKLGDVDVVITHETILQGKGIQR